MLKTSKSQTSANIFSMGPKSFFSYDGQETYAMVVCRGYGNPLSTAYLYPVSD